MTTARFTAPVSFWRTPDELVSYEEGQKITGEDAVFVLGIATLPVEEIDAKGNVIRVSERAAELAAAAAAAADVNLTDGDTAQAKEKTA